jgi:Arc/MetJ family transcription regulator
LPGGKNLDTAIGFDTKKIVISREDDLGVRLHGALKHHVILWIAAHPSTIPVISTRVPSLVYSFRVARTSSSF